MARGAAPPAVIEVRGCCPLDCQDTCSWVAEVADGRVVAVRGAKDHPVADRAIDTDFARFAALDLDAYAEQVSKWPPERAAEVCGVEAGTIARLAREFAAARPATIRCGIAPQQTHGGEAVVRGLSALAIVGGHWKYPGGGLFVTASPVLSEPAALNSTFANMTGQRHAMERPTLAIHPRDAEARGLVDGQEVHVGNERATVRAWLRVTDAVCAGVVALPGKWWGRAEDVGAVANLLTASAWSPGGQPAFNDTFVSVTEAARREAVRGGVS